jgi:hypothetical protein
MNGSVRFGPDFDLDTGLAFDLEAGFGADSGFGGFGFGESVRDNDRAPGGVRRDQPGAGASRRPGIFETRS